MIRKNSGRGRDRTSSSRDRGAAAGRGEKKSFGKKPTGNRKFSDAKLRRSPSSFGTDGDRKFSTDRRDKRDASERPFTRDRKPYAKREDNGERGGARGFSSTRGERKPYGDKPFSKERKPYAKGEDTRERGSSRGYSTGRDEKRSFGDKPFSKERKPYSKFEDKGERTSRPAGGKRYESKGKAFEKPSFKRRSTEERSDRDNGFSERAGRSGNTRSNSRVVKREDRRESFHASKKRYTQDDKPAFKKEFTGFKPEAPRGKQPLREDGRLAKRPKKAYDKTAKEFDKNTEDSVDFKPSHFSGDEKRTYSKGRKKEGEEKKTRETIELMDGSSRLNKYVANSGICSRREADDMIQAGLISVNGVVIIELGTKVNPGDVVKYNGETIRNEKLRYVLLNKPKDFITTTDDPQDRRTVMGLIEGACKERIYPVGRLDRNTTGVLLFTNDGDLAKKLTHPSYEIHKIYHVELDKNLKHTDLEKIRDGLQLEDGFIKVDDIQYDAGFEDKKQIGVEIHSGKNRIVRRIFESLDYSVIKLDRVIFAGLTKKDVPRGRWRVLTELEVNTLKMATSKAKKITTEKSRFVKGKLATTPATTSATKATTKPATKPATKTATGARPRVKRKTE